MTAAFSWPRAYLLDIYNKAISCGHLILEPVTEEEAASLKMSLYRLRRRSDTSNKSFITPEMHLVTVGKWADDKLPILFTSSPGRKLPEIKMLSGDFTTPAQLPNFHTPTIPTNSNDHVEIIEKKVFEIEQTALEMKPADISNYVANMLAKVKKEADDDAS